jgi:hypothetical protein
MGPPIGFIPLRDAADTLGRKMAGKNWRPLIERDPYTIACGLDPELDRVLKLIAEQCEAGEVAAAYRSITGVANLDPKVWQAPHWRNYFTAGTIDLTLPLVDGNLQPVSDGRTTRCTRDVFVRKDEIERLAAELSKPAATASRAGRRQIAEIVTLYRRDLGSSAPSIETLERFAHDRGLRGHRGELRAEYHRQFPGQQVGRPTVG